MTSSLLSEVDLWLLLQIVGPTGVLARGMGSGALILLILFADRLMISSTVCLRLMVAVKNSCSKCRINAIKYT